MAVLNRYSCYLYITMCTDSAYDVMEGKDINITCIPSVPLEWRCGTEYGKMFTNDRTIVEDSFFFMKNVTNNDTCSCFLRASSSFLASYDVRVQGTSLLF